MPPSNARSAFIVDLSKGFTMSEFYPMTHPTLEQALERLERDLLALGGELCIEVEPTGIRVEKEWVAWRSTHVSRFASRLTEHGARLVALRAEEAHADDLGKLLSAVTLPPRVVRAAGGFLAALSAAGVVGVSVNGATPVPREISKPTSPDRSGVNFDVALWTAHQIYEMVKQTAVRVEAEDLGRLHRELLAAGETERMEIVERMRQTAAWTLEQGGLERVLELVEGLRRDAEALARRSPAVRGQVMLALQKVATRPVVSALVERLGKARSEEERREIQTTLLHVGADVVTPLVRALTDATDLSARRAYRDALVMLDQVGIPLLEDMLGDERWFVVRNMVNILGEIRSADSLDHFARTIRHADARVRRETVLALTKLGGEESVPLLVRALSDPDPGIRGAAALGLGLARVTAVVPALASRLSQEQDLEAEQEMMRALGRLGDPRAVPVLLERARSRGWLSRRPDSARVEAVRALGAIGGEPARAGLEELTRDKAPEVRDAAARALRGEAPA